VLFPVATLNLVITAVVVALMPSHA
jgi:hypothetical protein